MSDFFSSLDVSSSALSAERLRMNLTSSNLANAQTTRTPEGGPYRRKDAVFEAQPFARELAAQMDAPLHQVKVTDIISDPNPPKLVYQPDHADANADGYVAYPNINTMEEMVNMINSSRTFEANVTVINTTRNMMHKALEIGRR